VDRADRKGPITMTIADDYGELKRHEWEFQHHTAFAYGILTPDKQSELACVYIAGRNAWLAGRMPKRAYASASSPLEGHFAQGPQGETSAHP
jgi:hypothetical protein